MKLSESQKKKIRNSAKGERCTIQLPGICNGDPDTVVWCHFPDESHGLGIKSFDLSGGYGCSSDHDFIDGRLKPKTHEERRIKLELDFFLRRAQTRTLKRLLEKGVIRI